MFNVVFMLISILKIESPFNVTHTHTPTLNRVVCWHVLFDFIQFLENVHIQIDFLFNFKFVVIFVSRFIIILYFFCV